MVHALREAHRVLKRDGVALDLRPAAVHRRVGITTGGRTRLIGVMRESFDDERAADRAVARTVRDGLFRVERRTSFPCRRVMDTLDEFDTWLDETVERHGDRPHEWLVRRLAQGLESARGARGRARIVVDGPLDLAVLRKLGGPAHVGRTSRRA